MNATYISTTVLLCILGLCALGYSLPAPSDSAQEGSQPLSPHLESARQMWNGAKKTLRRLNRREVTEPQTQQPQIDPAILANITGQKFILDLYKNLTNSTVHHKTTQGNTIRSLKYSNGKQL